jgi:hypothetical protein
MAALEIADVFRRFAPSYLATYGADMPPSHLRAIEDILACHTEVMGGHVYQCQDCGERFYVLHGCGNRACPSCHYARTLKWLDARREQMLPCPYYHVVFTLPEHLRAIARSNQSDCYSILMKAAVQALMTACANPHYLGATPAVMAVLHTWNASLDIHPHVHLLVSAGGVNGDEPQWRTPAKGFLAPVRVLSRLVEGIFMDLLAKKRPDLKAVLPRPKKHHKWVVWAQCIDDGVEHVLDYLGRYIHRIAIANCRILELNQTHVAFKHKDRKKNKWRVMRLTGHEFMRRFLQHVLPRGFHKVRYYGLWHPSKRKQFDRVRFALELKCGTVGKKTEQPLETDADPAQLIDPGTGEIIVLDTPPCPICGADNTCHVMHLKPIHKRGALQAKTRASPIEVV